VTLAGDGMHLFAETQTSANFSTSHGKAHKQQTLLLLTGPLSRCAKPPSEGTWGTTLTALLLWFIMESDEVSTRFM
jgi:hypothetical protein